MGCPPPDWSQKDADIFGDLHRARRDIRRRQASTCTGTVHVHITGDFFNKMMVAGLIDVYAGRAYPMDFVLPEQNNYGWYRKFSNITGNQNLNIGAHQLEKHRIQKQRSGFRQKHPSNSRGYDV